MENNTENVNSPVKEAELAAWQALCDAATPGTWIADAVFDAFDEWSFTVHRDLGHGRKEYITIDARTAQDAEFISTSHAAMPRLIAEVKRLNDKLSLYGVEIEELEGEKQGAEEWVQDIFTALKKNFPPCDDDPTEDGLYAKQVVDYIRGLVAENERLKGGAV